MECAVDDRSCAVGAAAAFVTHRTTWRAETRAGGQAACPLSQLPESVKSAGRL
jgi:hypothetical protein